ncbi:cation:proton antiporter [Candidatus Nucleicultrix amoebiphila]|jgi:CPA2 family monovalent cation:H+ antiporter-2|uniref:cation:proton antiporter n=1 Tax=Candidatus Nucleicultrix amoebiphila TaxID=1509244 RepID=UPI000A2710BB|nr:cation:proton antiporter [Candidatus Nucleicultrix amoebiphila]
MHVQIHLTEIALIVVAALGCGLIFERLRQPAVLGYILAGIILSFPIFGLIQNQHFVSALAELGVLMLLFLVGMELSFDSFRSVWHISLITAAMQIGASLLTTFGLGSFFGWTTGFCLLIAFAIALSSTAVAVKMLESMDELKTSSGKLALGILIAQDLAIVPMILFLRSYENGVSASILIKVGLSIVILAGLFWYLNRRKQFHFSFLKLVSGHHDLMPIAALVFCFGIAAISGLIGLSAAYGAFLGGLILGNTAKRDLMIQTTKPIQSVLLMVFFLSVGLLMDLHFIWQNLLKVFLLLTFITIGKTFMNIFILHFLGRPWTESFLVSLVLSQVGEFAFLLATIGMDTKIIKDDGYKMIIVLTALSLAISPLWMASARRLHDKAPKHLRTFKQYLKTAYEPEAELVDVFKNTYRKIHKLIKNNFK